MARKTKYDGLKGAAPMPSEKTPKYQGGYLVTFL